MPDSQFWQRYYETEEILPWDIQGPAPPLQQMLESHFLALPEKGKVGVLGCGRGHDAALFASHGFDTTGFDYAPGAIQQATERYGEKDPCLHFVLADLFQLPQSYRHTFDAIVEHTCYCAIPPARRNDYMEVAKAILKPGGSLIALFWMHEMPGGPPYATTPEEIRMRFEKDFNFLHFEKTPHSVPLRANQEWLGVLRKK